MATITKTQSANYRRLPLWLISRWPDAESCCGVLLCVFDNKDKCWEATNGVRSAYNDSLRSAIDEILDDNEDHLGEDARYRPFFCHSIYMVGRKKKRSNPVIFFCCEDSPLRVKARDVIKANSVTRRYPAIRLGHTSFPPELNAPPRFVTTRVSHMHLGSAGLKTSLNISDSIPSPPDELERIMSLRSRPSLPDEPDWDEPVRTINWRSIDKTKVSLRPKSVQLDLLSRPRITEHRIREEGGGSGRRVFYKPGKRNLCAVKVFLDEATPFERGITATVGGAIVLNGKTYGLTAAHGLVESFQRPDSQSNVVRSVEYDGDSANSFEHYSSDEDELMGRNVTSLSPSSATSQEEPGKPQTRNEKGKRVATVPRQDLDISAALLGTTAFTSIVNGSLGLDWALIEILDYGFLSVNTFSMGDFAQHENRQVQISGLVQTLPTSRSPVLALVERDSLTGTISGTAVSVRLPGSSKMCEIWTVQLDGNIEEGDCGSLVVDPSNGNVYGHIVAGNIGTGFAYIVPAYHTQKDINERFGIKFKFATTEDYKRSATSETIPKAGNIIGSTPDDPGQVLSLDQMVGDGSATSSKPARSDSGFKKPLEENPGQQQILKDADSPSTIFPSVLDRAANESQLDPPWRPAHFWDDLEDDENIDDGGEFSRYSMIDTPPKQSFVRKLKNSFAIRPIQEATRRAARTLALRRSIRANPNDNDEYDDHFDSHIVRRTSSGNLRVVDRRRSTSLTGDPIRGAISKLSASAKKLFNPKPKEKVGELRVPSQEVLELGADGELRW